jgi:leader peptidase (prepilin peptidase)/N-methyltransferase
MLYNYFLIAVLGLVIGSFLNVCIYRLPEGKSILKPPSHCPKCKKRLKGIDLIPVFGYLLLQGRCRYCKASIPPRYVFVELVTSIVFVFLYSKYGYSAEFMAAAYIMSILIAVLFIDARHKIIPNELVLAGLAGAVPLILYNAFYPLEFYGDSRWWSPLLGILPGTGFLFLVALAGLFIYGSDEAIGMGDVKIFAPIGIFLGWRMCIIALLVSIIMAGASGAALVAARIRKRRDTVPFGPFIVIGTFTAFMWGQKILEWYIGKLD